VLFRILLLGVALRPKVMPLLKEVVKESPEDFRGIRG